MDLLKIDIDLLINYISLFSVRMIQALNDPNREFGDVAGEENNIYQGVG